MTDWARIQGDVKQKLARAKAAPAILHKQGAPTGPAHAPTYPTTDHPCVALLGNFSGQERDGTSIAMTDVKMMVPALDVEPTATDTISVGERVYEIVAVMPYMPGGVVLYWKLAARR